MARKILIFVSFILALISCKEEEIKGINNHHNFDKDLLPLLFSQDSYWIYDDQYGNLDTVVLISSEIDTLYERIGAGSTASYEVYNLEFESSNYGIYIEQYVGYLISRGSIYGGYTYLSSFRVGEENDNALLSEIHDSLEINGIVYCNVVEMQISKDEYIANDMILFYVDSVGVIKKILIESLNDSITWQLIDYEVALKF